MGASRYFASRARYCSTVIGRPKEGGESARTIAELGLEDAITFVSGVTDERIEMPEMAPDTHEEGASVRNTLKATAITRPGREAAAERKAKAA